MVVKYGVVGVFSVIEGLIFDSLTSLHLNPGKKFRTTLKRARQADVISESLLDDLVEVHEMREKIHLHLYDVSGTKRYDIDDWNFAIATLHGLSDELRKR